MPVAVNQPKFEQKDPMDTILKGLQVAQGIYGIKDAGVKADQLRAQTELQKQQTEVQGQLAQKQMAQLDRENSGIVLPKDILAQAGKYIPAQEGDASAIPFRVQGANGVETVYLKPPKNAEDSSLAGLIKQQQAMLQGLQIQEHVKKAGEIEGPKAQAATFGRRMEQADNVFNGLEANGYDRSSAYNSVAAMLPGAFQGGQTKQQEQAERNFVNALLRKESGAAISKDEFSSAEKQYFKRAGDTPEVIAQKAQNRAQAIAGMQAEAGHAWDKIPLVATQEVRPRTNAFIDHLSNQGTAQAAAAPTTIKQNGFTYTLNPKTGKYE